MRLSIAVIASTAAFTQFAVAADLPRKAPAIPAVAPLYNWTGCYVGANAGWIGSSDKITNSPGPGLIAEEGLTPAQIAAATQQITLSDSGFTGGGQIGCTWQGAGSPLALGIEADFNGSSLKGSATAAFPFNPISGFTAHTETNTRDLTWFSTVRGRVGYAMDRWLVYATGGLAVAHINSSLNLQYANGSYNGSDSRTRAGYTVGGGVEYSFAQNWSAKLEYLYLDLGTYTFISPNSNDPLADWATSVRAREHVVRVGLNYKIY